MGLFELNPLARQRRARRSFVLLALAMATLAWSGTPTASAYPSNVGLMTMVFNDEFDGPNVSSNFLGDRSLRLIVKRWEGR